MIENISLEMGLNWLFQALSFSFELVGENILYVFFILD